MFDTHVTIVGNVLTAPEMRRTKNTGSLVAHFKVASTARRLDRETGQWVDGNSFRVRVNCWRKLAEGVRASVITGDPVIVVGRLYTRDWTDENDNHRIGYELEAIAVGHDLSRGQGTFTRNRPALSTSVVEDEPGVVRVRGEETDPVPTGQAAVASGYGDAGLANTGDELLGEDDDLGAADDLAAGLGESSDAGPFSGALAATAPTGGFAGGVDGLEASDEEHGGGPDPVEDRPVRGRRRGRTAVPV